MKRRKKCLLTLILLLTLFGSSVTKAQTLVLHHADGTTTDVQLYTLPKVTFQGDNVVIASTVLNMEYPKSDILRFTYKGSFTGISSPTAKANYAERDGQLVFNGISQQDKIAVYTASGIRVPVNIQRTGDAAVLPPSAIPSGVYLLNVNGRTSKFTKP